MFLSVYVCLYTMMVYSICLCLTNKHTHTHTYVAHMYNPLCAFYDASLCYVHTHDEEHAIHMWIAAYSSTPRHMSTCTFQKQALMHTRACTQMYVVRDWLAEWFSLVMP